MQIGDVKKFFQASQPDKGGEGSRINEFVHQIINNEVDINGPGDDLLQEAIKVHD